MYRHFFTALLLSLSFLSTFANENKVYVVHYAIRLDSIACSRPGFKSPSIVSENFNDLDSIPYTRYRMDDGVLDMTWYVSDIAFNFTIRNKTPFTAYLPLKSVNGLDFKGHYVNFGYEFEDKRDNPIFRIRGKRFSAGFLIPRSNYPNRRQKEGVISPLLPNTFSSATDAHIQAESMIGKRFRLSFTIRQAGTRCRYDLFFVSEGASIIIKKEKENDIEIPPEDVAQLYRHGGIDQDYPEWMF